MGVVDEAVGEAINLGSGYDNRVRDMAEIVNDLTSNPEGIAYTSRRNWDAKTRLLSSIEKAEKILQLQTTNKIQRRIKKNTQLV